MSGSTSRSYSKSLAILGRLVNGIIGIGPRGRSNVPKMGFPAYVFERPSPQVIKEAVLQSTQVQALAFLNRWNGCLPGQQHLCMVCAVYWPAGARPTKVDTLAFFSKVLGEQVDARQRKWKCFFRSLLATIRPVSPVFVDMHFGRTASAAWQLEIEPEGYVRWHGVSGEQGRVAAEFRSTFHEEPRPSLLEFSLALKTSEGMQPLWRQWLWHLGSLLEKTVHAARHQPRQRPSRATRERKKLRQGKFTKKMQGTPLP